MAWHGPKLNSTDIKAFETFVGHRLPARYRSFLLKYNGGRPDLRDYRNEDGSGASIERFFSISDSDGNLFDEYRRSASDHILPAHVIPIGDDGGGNWICLSLDGANAGSTYFWDHDGADVGGGYDHLQLLTRRFSDLLNGLIDTFDQSVFDENREFSDIIDLTDLARLDSKIASGWDINKQRVTTTTMIEDAVIANNLVIVEHLLKNGADPRKAMKVALTLQQIVGKHGEMIALLERYGVTP